MAMSTIFGKLTLDDLESVYQIIDFLNKNAKIPFTDLESKYLRGCDLKKFCEYIIETSGMYVPQEAIPFIKPYLENIKLLHVPHHFHNAFLLRKENSNKVLEGFIIIPHGLTQCLKLVCLLYDIRGHKSDLIERFDLRPISWYIVYSYMKTPTLLPINTLKICLEQASNSKDDAIEINEGLLYWPAVLFCIFHELGHFHLKHKKSKIVKSYNNFDLSKGYEFELNHKNEIDADKFSINICKNISCIFSGIHLFYHYISAIELSYNYKMSSHPHTILRMIEIYKCFKNEMSKTEKEGFENTIEYLKDLLGFEIRQENPKKSQLEKMIRLTIRDHIKMLFYILKKQFCFDLSSDQVLSDLNDINQSLSIYNLRIEKDFIELITKK